MADISKIKPLGSNTIYDIKDNSAIANITCDGTTFTVTRRNGTTSTFTQQDIDTKVNVVARGTTKAYLLADTNKPTSTAAAHTAVAEEGVYLDTEAGRLVTTSFKTGALTLGRNIWDYNNSAPGQGDAILTALGYKTGYPIYTDPTFLSGTNSVGVYNNAWNETVSIGRDTYSNYGVNSPGTNSNYILKVTSAGTARPGIGGIVQNIVSRANAQFIQIFRALIPIGRNVFGSSNSMGTAYKDQWLTSTAGTGKWEWYARRVICGQEGNFSNGGHVYLDGAATTPDAPVTWYLAYCNVYDITRADYDGLRTRYADSSSACTGNAATATTASKLSNTSKIGDTNKPVYFKADGTPAAINYTIDKSVPSNAIFTDRYVNSATFADDSTNTAASPVKMTLTRAGSDTVTITANIPKVSSSSAGVAPKGTAVNSQSQSTKFLREDGTWATPSYTVNTNTDTLVKQTEKSDNKNYKILFTTSDSPTSGNANEAAYDTGITINPSSHTLQTGRYFHNVVSFESLGTPKEILIKTKIPFVTSVGMPKIIFHMNNYYNGTPTELALVFYIYNRAFRNYGVTSNSTHRPVVTLSTYEENGTDYVAIGLGLIGTANYPNAFFTRFNVDVLDIWIGQERNYCNGWTVIENTDTTTIIPTANQVTLSYKDSANQVENNLILKIKSGTTEGTDCYTFNGSTAKTLNILQGTGITLTAAANSLTIANAGVTGVKGNSETNYRTGNVNITPANILGSSSTAQFYRGDNTWANLQEAYLEWGGRNFSNSYGCIDAAMVSDLGANRLMFLKPAGIIIEYSRDGGSTWTDYNATDQEKRGLFAVGGSFLIGKADASNKATANGTNYQLRVTLSFPAAGTYTVLNKFVLFVSTNGSLNCTTTIQIAKQNTADNTNFIYTDIATNIPISGWSGYNVINVSDFTTYSGSAKQADLQYGRIRFIFKANGGNTDYEGLQIRQIMGFGGVGWNTPSTMAKTGHLYAYDNSMNATFPAQVTATQFNGNATTASKLQTGKTLKVNLASTNTSTAFDGSANITDIGVSGVLSVANGGTGQSSFTTDALLAYDGLKISEAAPEGSETCPIYIDTNGVPQSIDSYEGNAATATAIETAGTTAQFYRGDNTWSNILTQTDATTLGINTSNLKIGTAIRTLHIATSSMGTDSGVANGQTAGITFGISTAAYAGIYYQSSGNYGSRLYFATTNSFDNGAYARMMITHLGNVGIGTVSPSTRLHVDGDVTITGLTASQAVFTDENKKLVSRAIKNNTTISHLGWASVSNDIMPVTSNTIAFWNGAFQGTSSNLKYSANGEIVGLSTAQTISATKTFNAIQKFTNITDSGHSQDETASVSISGGLSVAKNISTKAIRIDNNNSSKGVSLEYNSILETLNFVFS